MIAGALLLAVVWVFLLRYVPDRRVRVPDDLGPAPLPSRSDLLRAFVPKAAIDAGVPARVRALGGWLLAGRMLAPLTRITDATRMAATGSLSHRIRLEGRTDEFRELADAFDSMLARLEAQVAEQQRFAANASHELRTPLAITQTLLDVARNDPDRGNDELVDRLHFVNTRAIDLTEALLLLSRADQRSFTREHVDLSLLAEEATETLLPLAEKRGVTIETSGDATPTTGSPALLQQMATNLVHNAIVHNLPEHGTVWVTTGAHPRSVRAHGREHRRAADPAAGLHARRAVPARQRTHPHRPRGRRPRPGDRQEHHPGPRRDAHAHAPGRRRTPRHGAAPRRARIAHISPAYRKSHTRRQHPVAFTEGMRIAIYGCGPDEAALFRELAPGLGVLPTITEAAVSEGNVGPGAREPVHQHRPQDAGHGLHAARAQRSRRDVHLHQKRRLRPHRRRLRRARRHLRARPSPTRPTAWPTTR